ncbi:MAG: hypothetical protein R2771_11420 [Saprospiraceae bacterium]
MQITTIDFRGINENVIYDKDPTECPFCHKKITSRKHQAYTKDDRLEIVYRCPNPECGRLFISYYKKITSEIMYKYECSSIGTFKSRIFSENITTLSITFTEIYNQALESENLNLNHLTGIGSRKSIEFLIKDYLISKQPDNEENIKKKFLGKCIKEDIDNPNLKDIAERATWLGNDETHYVRKWENKDINDLKKLIDLTLHWIEMEILTEQYKNELK